MRRGGVGIGVGRTSKGDGWWTARPGLISAALLAITALGACETQSITRIREPYEPAKHREVRIEPCVDRTGFKGDRDLAAESTQELIEKLRASAFFDIKTDGRLVLTCDIERFAEGSAAKRWLMPGWGATQATVAVTVWEMPRGRPLATLRSQSSVSAGGLYTVGADQYILGVAFSDIVKQLESWAKNDDAIKQKEP